MDRLLHTEERAQAAILEEQHGLRPTNEDIFSGQYSALWASGSEHYRMLAATQAAFFRAAMDQREQREVLEQTAVYVEECRRSFLGDELFDKLTAPDIRRSVGRTVRGAGIFDRYAHTITEDDLPKLAEWVSGVDRIKANIRRLYADKPFSPETHLLRSRLGNKPEEPHLTRLSIALFLMHTSEDWHELLSPSIACVRALIPRENALSSFGEGVDLCVDEAMVGKILADHYGEHAEVISPSESAGKTLGNVFGSFFRGKLMDVISEIVKVADNAHNSLRFDDGGHIDLLCLSHYGGYARTDLEMALATDGDIDYDKRYLWKDLARDLLC